MIQISRDVDKHTMITGDNYDYIIPVYWLSIFFFSDYGAIEYRMMSPGVRGWVVLMELGCCTTQNK